MQIAHLLAIVASSLAEDMTPGVLQAVISGQMGIFELYRFGGGDYQSLGGALQPQEQDSATLEDTAPLLGPPAAPAAKLSPAR